MSTAEIAPHLVIPDSLAWAHPIVQEWFVRKFGTPTEPQIGGWPQILAGRPTLISAPTGSGKTLSAFLACIDRLVRKALAGELQDRIEVLYVSPLKALGNDIHKNLEAPLGEIMQLAAERGLLMPPIRSAVRTGDTPTRDRVRMLRQPPHILVTTPESLYILLTAEKSRAMLRHVETLIVDEIHAVADDKRGAHLSLSLERLAILTARPPRRIGLSATQKPLELVANFLTGVQSDDNARLFSNTTNDVAIVNVGHRREMDIAVEVPRSELGAVASNPQWDEVYDRIVELSAQHRSTLVFVNTRARAERIAHQLGERLGMENVAAHHGSLSRRLRLEAETRLKKGEIKVLVATASLELGIDIGSVDLVCQINSPRSIAVGLQRVGRAGHWRGAIPKGRFFATTRDDLIECAALVRAMRAGELDELVIPESPLDVLAQQIVAMCATEEWNEQDLLTVIRRAYPYRDLGEKEFEELLTMLSEGIVSRRGRYGSYLFRDQVNHRVKGRRGARLTAITNGGAIPDTAIFSVICAPEGTPVATLDEDFAVECSAGDIILLGNTSWRVRRVESSGRVFVEDAHGAPPTVPFWLGEAPGRTAELSRAVSGLRKEISDRTPAVAPGFVLGSLQPEVLAAREWLAAECGVDMGAAEQMIEYIVSGRSILREVPTRECVIAERFFDEGGGMQLIIHAPFGQRINKAWGLSLRKKFCRSFNFELQAAATDNGINISLAEQHSFALDEVFRFLAAGSVKQTLEQASLDSPIFAARWRWDAGRSLVLTRFRGGKKVPPQVQRIRSDDLLASVFPNVAACQENVTFPIAIPDHPLVREVMKDVLHEAMDVDGLRDIVAGLHDGSVRFLAVDTPVPSVFSHEILNANPYAYLDDAPLEERRARAVEMRRTLPANLLDEIGRLDPAAIAEVREEAWPDIRDADELHDALQAFIALPEKLTAIAHPDPSDAWGTHFPQLVHQGRASRAIVHGQTFWVVAERAQQFTAIYPEASFERELPAIGGVFAGPDDALLAAVTGWLAHAGPITAARLAETLAVPAKEIFKALLRIEAGGAALRGQFESAEAKPQDELVEWCDRRLLARIHRLTVGALRKQVEPVSGGIFMRWLTHWQGVAPGAQRMGERGLLQVLKQLQGFEVPANAWERQVLARRLQNYAPESLDRLCLTGAVGWGRLTPHPATIESREPGTQNTLRRIVPTSVAPVTFFIREDADWMTAKRGTDESTFLNGLSAQAARVYELLRLQGASFFADIVRAGDMLKAEVETALWELVAAGLVTADGFDNLRALIDPKRRSGEGRGRSTRPRHSGGRWSLLFAQQAPSHAKMLEATCRMLLDRYGIVFRELLARESIQPRWRELLITLRRLEDRGEVRGGRFLQGFLGEQFALPEAVDSLRDMRRSLEAGKMADETVTLSAADPLNLIGIVVPGDRVPAISGRFLTLKNGLPVRGEEAAIEIGTPA